ncbi:MAG TPA: DUF2304 domain-containing protein [Candidatus Limnocylindrales bacterium]|nr:DUF2304 domain-containing protein [Candidatus Limnocylindrales bacterium]
MTEEQLRALLLADSDTTAVRVVALTVALALFFVVFDAVRRRRLSESLTPIWLTCAFAVLVLAVDLKLLEAMTHLIGAWTPSSTVFFFALLFLLAISLSYGIVLTRLGRQVTRLAQEIAMLRARIRDDEE